MTVAWSMRRDGYVLTQRGPKNVKHSSKSNEKKNPVFTDRERTDTHVQGNGNYSTIRAELGAALRNRDDN